MNTETNSSNNYLVALSLAALLNTPLAQGASTFNLKTNEADVRGLSYSEWAPQWWIWALNCRIPVGTALLFPIIYRAVFFFPDDPLPDTEQDLRDLVSCSAEPILSAQIDGQAVVTDAGYLFEQSELFEFVVPADTRLDTLLGFGGTLPKPSVDEGHYVFLQPNWGPGMRMLEFGGEDGCDLAQPTVTYHLDVHLPGKRSLH